MNARKLTLATLSVLCAVVGVLALASAPALARKEYVAGAKFGSEGSGNGQFSEPAGLAVNDSTELVAGVGDVYVVDRGHGRVERFSSAGAYLGQFNGSGNFEIEGKVQKGATAPAGQLLAPEWIAVDDSGKPALEDPSVGDVYVADAGHKVVDKFSPTGEYLSQISESEVGKPLGLLLGVAVDPSGDVLIDEDKRGFEPTIRIFSDDGAYLSETYLGGGQPQPNGLAVDSSGAFYAVSRGQEEQTRELYKQPSEVALAPDVSAFAVDPANNGLLADKESAIDRYGPFGEPYGEPLETFPSEGLSESHGLAVNATSGAVYASERTADDVATFDYVLLPTASTEAATSVSEASATLSGTIETEGEAITECRFEYGSETSYGQSVACQQTPAEIDALSKGGTVPVKVSATAPVLQPRSTYDFRLDAADANGVGHGQNKALYTFARPLVEATTLANVGSTEASVAAKLAPGGVSTSYRVEYGTSSVEELSTPEASAGAAETSIDISVLINALQPQTTYHLRLVASNALGTALGEELTLTTNGAATVGGGSGEAGCPNRTFSGFETALPDCRAYELVSSAIDDSYVPNYGENGSYAPGSGEVVGERGNYRASLDGDRLAYMGGPSATGIGGSGKTSNGDGNHYLAVRGAQRWEASDVEISTNAEIGGEEFTGFSGDLSTETVTANAVEVPGAQPEPLSDCEGATLFSRTDSGLHALVGMNKGSRFCYGEVAGISADDSHILFAAAGAYTEAAEQGTEGNNLYDSVDGTVRQVNVLPNGEPERHPDAAFGRYEKNYSNIVNADGSRILWGALEGSSEKALYVRENDAQPQSPIANGRCSVATDACTVQVDAAEPEAPEAGGDGQYWTASSDGARVFFTDQRRLTKSATAASGEPDLYEYEVNRETGASGTLTDLTVDGHAGEHANVQGVIGASEDGSYVYFVAGGVLAGANAEGKTPIAGQPNLYMGHGGATIFVATLENRDNEIENRGSGNIGDWTARLGTRSAEVSPGGRAVGFMSHAPLTGYDSQSLPEVFVYDAESGRIACVSCSRTGAAPAATRETAAFAGGLVATSGNPSFTLRWINEREGLQVYFMTDQPLAPSDTNGLEDVYEWESDGSGNCQATDACVGLLSSADPLSNAYFVDASANGADVFITSRAQLVASAFDETVKVYDVGVDGGVPETSLACTGTGCQGVPPAPPIFATPSSVTFNGVGNFEPAPAPPAKAKAKPKKKLVKCKRSLVKKRGRCVKRSKSKSKSSTTRKGK